MMKETTINTWGKISLIIIAIYVVSAMIFEFIKGAPILSALIGLVLSFVILWIFLYPYYWLVFNKK